MELNGKKVRLVPIRTEEKDEFYELVTKSYGSRFWYDERRLKARTKKRVL